MTGYQETLTDPSYHRQVVVMTSPHVGNTGMNDEDPESRRIWVSGYVVRDPARVPSNWRSVALARRRAARPGRGRHQRHRHPRADPAPARARRHAGRHLLGQRPTPTRCSPGSRSRRRWPGPSSRRGLHRGGLRRPGGRREAVHGRRDRPRHQGEHPADDGRARHRGARAARDRVARGRAGRPARRLFFSNGPGDPAATTAQVELLRGALEQGLPYFGICFGNQLFGRALGFGTYKLKYGHRGINQPVMDRTTGKVEVTAHNHGFAVDAPLDGRPRRPSAS